MKQYYCFARGFILIKPRSRRRNSGFTSLEVILAAAMFMIFGTGMIVLLLQSLDSNRIGQEMTTATAYANEGLEQIRSIRNQSYAYPSSLTYTGGITLTSGVASLSGQPNNTFGKYTRVMTLNSVERDCNGNIVTSGGSGDVNALKATSTVTWNFNDNRNESVTLTSYLTRWKTPLGSGNSGMLVYGDQSNTPDGISYRLFDTTTGTWSPPAATADIDPTSTNQVLHAVRLYASSTRNEKIAISRHFDGTTQYIYAQVYNGISWCPTLLTSFNDTSNLDVQNFDGTYLSNGDFMIIYSDNTSVPKFRIWNGTSWNPPEGSPGISMQDLRDNNSRTPLWIVARAKPGSNNIMAAFLGTAKDTNTEYFNGGSYTTSSWTLQARHGATAPSTSNVLDFAWSPSNPDIGTLYFANQNNDKKINVQQWNDATQRWSTLSNNTTSQGQLGPMRAISETTSTNFLACNQDENFDIDCFRTTGTSWTRPANYRLTNNTDRGSQRAFDIGFESNTGTNAIAVYSDTTNTPQLKKYNTNTNKFDSNATAIGTLNAALKTVRIEPAPTSDDMMILMGDDASPPDLYTALWNGTTNSLYTDNERAIREQGSNGPDATEYWYDFTWDQY